MKEKENIDKDILLLNKKIQDVKNLEELKQLKSHFTSKSKTLNYLKLLIKESTDNDEIKALGESIKFYNNAVFEILNNKKFELENNYLIKKRDNLLLNDSNNFILKSENKGAMHPLTKISRLVESFFDENNYHYFHGLEVEDEKYNFDILNIPKNHPARTFHDTFYLENGKLLRTHATNCTARELASIEKKTYRSYSIGTVFRNDENDSTHSFQFNQIDIFAIGKYSIVNLKYTIEMLLKSLFSKNLKIVFRPSYFPFTEPSYEVDISCPKCIGYGCNICSKSGYIEILGSGMINPNVIKNAKKDPKKIRGFAAGIGLERLAMIKWNIDDIRKFFLNDIEFLKNYSKGEK